MDIAKKRLLHAINCDRMKLQLSVIDMKLGGIIMNLIVIVLDSFRQDHVSTYHKDTPVFEGIAPCQTPNIDQFAEECVVFENAYPEALPTIPIRTQLMTGQRTLPYRPWQPLTPEDVAIAQILSQEGLCFWTHFGYLSLPRPKNELPPRLPRLPLDSWTGI